MKATGADRKDRGLQKGHSCVARQLETCNEVFQWVRREKMAARDPGSEKRMLHSRPQSLLRTILIPTRNNG